MGHITLTHSTMHYELRSITIALTPSRRFKVTDNELKRLFRKFKRLDTDKSGSLSVSEFLAIPELEHNPLVRRVVSTFDRDHSVEVDFKEFIEAITLFVRKDDVKNLNEK